MFIICDANNGYSESFLDIFSLFSIFAGIFTIISKNPIVSVLFLIGLFLGIATYLITIGLSFIGLSYLLVYIGAVSILFLFILMLINVRVSELVSNTSNSIPLAIITSIFFNYGMLPLLPFSLGFTFLIFKDYSSSLKHFYSYTLLPFMDNKAKIYFATSNSWEGNLSETSHITGIGNVIYSHYCIWLVITSIILLLAMVGAIVITIRQDSSEGSLIQSNAQTAPLQSSFFSIIILACNNFLSKVTFIKNIKSIWNNAYSNFKNRITTAFFFKMFTIILIVYCTRQLIILIFSLDMSNLTHLGYTIFIAIIIRYIVTYIWKAADQYLMKLGGDCSTNCPAIKDSQINSSTTSISGTDLR